VRKYPVLIALLALLHGCASTPVVNTSNIAPVEYETVRQLPQTPSVLWVGDVIDILRLDDDKPLRVQIRPDGNISYPYAGSIKLAGLTLDDAAHHLEGKLSASLQAPQVVINLVESPGNRAFVGGDVRNQGPVDLKGGLSLQQSVFVAGGVTASGDSENIVLLRQPTPDSAYNLYRINIGEVFGTKAEHRQAIWLQRGDIVFVPRSGVGHVMQLVEHITKSIPFNPSISAVYNLRPYPQQ